MTDETLRPTYRILDASTNRAVEGLRTLEEYARLAIDDASLSAELKSIRHAIAAAVGRLPREKLLASRDTSGDVGTTISEPAELVRSSLADVVAAASSRTSQSLRVIEEYGKTLNPALAADIERTRYRFYDVAGELELKVLQQPKPDQRRQRLARSVLYVLVDAGPDEKVFQKSIAELYGSGVDVVQLRDQQCDDRTLIQRSRVATRVARQFGGLLIVNDRADLAVAADADGVHVGQDELPVADARRILGPSKLVGLSTHSIDQARDAAAVGADYIGCGPVFLGKTKTFSSYVGPAFLAEVAAEISLPAFAIGGIDLTNLDQVIDAGCRRIAVAGAVRDSSDPNGTIAEMRRKLVDPPALLE